MPWCSSPLVDIFVQGIRIEWHVFVLVEFCLQFDIVSRGVWFVGHPTNGGTKGTPLFYPSLLDRSYGL